ncbi:MAG: hypothetical protein IJF69_03625, partial [Clostridia bacterium]|nr:hypothetical protein [Clostridia bacterium]
KWRQPAQTESGTATGGRLRALPVADEASNKEWQRSTIGKWRQPAQTESGTATGLVRRIEECVILGQTA